MFMEWLAPEWSILRVVSGDEQTESKVKNVN